MILRRVWNSGGPHGTIGCPFDYGTSMSMSMSMSISISIGISISIRIRIGNNISCFSIRISSWLVGLINLSVLVLSSSSSSSSSNSWFISSSCLLFTAFLREYKRSLYLCGRRKVSVRRNNL